MEERNHPKLQPRSLKSGRRSAVNLSELSLVKTDYLTPEDGMPLVIRPAVADVDLADWAASHRSEIESHLLKHGAILFRDFNLKSVAQFEQAASAICSDLFSEYGDLPPESGAEKVYQSTPYPEEQTILFHNEASHTHRWPLKQFFFCVQPAEQGGETPIVDCREVYRVLDPALVRRFEEKGLMYVRNFIAALDVSWQEFFKTTDRAAVEQYCREAGIEFEWKGEDGLRIHQICPAIARHPKTGETVFFNQLQLHHVSCLLPHVRASLLSLYREEDLPRNVYYGDGTPIEESVMEQVGEAYLQTATSFPWEKGDILMVDNMLVAHGRNPFKGSRKIVVAMGEIISNNDLRAS
ncbi:MAG TPA: TauD/TfdA family dioxygenase [Pyrinomonadaceae bacterium]|nr:TauD/TfdA family dioxygenase [Pyrinomonadaceae bacterium]